MKYLCAVLRLVFLLLRVIQCSDSINVFMEGWELCFRKVGSRWLESLCGHRSDLERYMLTDRFI